MDDTLKKILEQPPMWEPFALRLDGVMAAMDAAYTKVAEGYGFHCRGCADSCCETLFYHHTLAELFSLRAGIAEVPASRQAEFRRRAVDWQGRMAAGQPESPRRILCPLNDKGLCAVYARRPMICRLHGLPHEVCRPGIPAARGPGCAEFGSRCGGRACRPLDRTPHYARMAALEGDLRRACGFTGRIRLTVAEMVILLVPALPPPRRGGAGR